MSYGEWMNFQRRQLWQNCFAFLLKRTSEQIKGLKIPDLAFMRNNEELQQLSH